MSSVKFVAIGRLVKQDGVYEEGSHIIIVECAGNKKDKDHIHTYHNHIKAIMNKGAHILQPGKRIRLTSDNDDYELHAMKDSFNEDINDKIVFFAVTDIDFAKNYLVATLLQDIKDELYMNCSPYEIVNATANSLQRQLDKSLFGVIQKYAYGSSKLATVKTKADDVNSLVQEAMKKALTNADQMDEIENISGDLEKQGLIFVKQQLKSNENTVVIIIRWLVLYAWLYVE